MNGRRRWLGVLLGLTLLATWYVAQMDEGAAPERGEPGAGPVERRRAHAAAALLPVKRPPFAAAEADLFAPASFEPPPPPPPKIVAPPPRPVPPPLPFRYVGRLVEEGVARVFVTRGNTTLMLAAGQVVDGQWKVEAISGFDVSFIYLPLGERVSMAARSSE
ncbi:MAG: hypothetical protein KF778_02715 [Rhodocyclaceae bacterium]|nr:hypothetical protein [Rhodocyclaceae bacterium]MBX3667289.1 hypothetical protein [Rhodocyclaceae bacterium]